MGAVYKSKFTGPEIDDKLTLLPIANGGTGAVSPTDALYNLSGYDLRLGKQIVAGENLNDYTTPGTYYCTDSNISAQIENTPNVATGFKLVVMQAGYSSQFKQIAYLNSSYQIYERYKAGNNNWTPWLSILTVAPKDNLLDNWYFIGGGSQSGYGKFPINQRGNISYSTNSYTIDRWESSNMTVTIENNAVNITSANTANWKRFRQNLLTPLEEGQIYTISMLYKLNSKSGNVTFRINYNELSGVSGGGINIPSTTEVPLLLSHTITVPQGQGVNNAVEILVSNTTNDSVDIDIYAIKLERGTTTTLAQRYGDKFQLIETPNFTKQMDICQHYLYVIAPTDVMRLPLAYACSTTTAHVVIPFKHSMVKIPTLSVTNAAGFKLSLTYINSSTNASSATLLTATTEFGEIELAATGLTASHSYRCSLSNGSKLIFSAEL